ncbi:MAG: 50S ribosome-binding GTPase [Planctomycetaceae bacterium]|jgi:tRNA modification GTPase|nr:50S ribosome-binding GTPase [Planctomycetaceae bacterium]
MKPANSKLYCPLLIIRLTPPGRGAVAALLLHGENVLDVFHRHFSKRIEPDETRHHFGTFQLEHLNRTEQLVVYCPNRNEVELHCHGGEIIVAEIEAVLIRDGAVPVPWQEFFCRGNSQRNIALRQLPFAPTERTAQILLAQYNGALERELSYINSLQDETEKEYRRKRLEENVPIGKHLIEPFRVVLAGASNAGKSSLLNAVAGFQRSIVHQTPGTTRDVVSFQTAINGFPFEFSDTAGFRLNEVDCANPASPIEQEGIKRTGAMLTESDLILWLIDATLSAQEQLMPPVEFLSKTLLCFNKIDLLSDCESLNSVSVSAATGEGIEALLETVLGQLIPHPPEPDEAVPLHY